MKSAFAFVWAPVVGFAIDRELARLGDTTAAFWPVAALGALACVAALVLRARPTVEPGAQKQAR